MVCFFLLLGKMTSLCFLYINNNHMKEHTTWLCGGESRVCAHNVLGVQDVDNDSCVLFPFLKKECVDYEQNLHESVH